MVIMAKIGMISLGCPRNLVDSEVMLGCLKKSGYSISESIEGSDVAIVNTCAFIRDAVEESVETVLECARLKKAGKIGRIIVAGCLAQRYKKSLAKELAEVDGFVGTGDFHKINSIVRAVIADNKRFIVSKDPDFVYDHKCRRELITPAHSVYVKIQEGCANVCSYCVIPSLRGRLRSRPIRSILSEVKALAAGGAVPEINIIGQDTTAYGRDLYGKSAIAELLKGLSALGAAHWIRLLYTHPAHWTEELIAVMRDNKCIARYVDLPIQHISDKVLKKMHRNTTPASIKRLLGSIRKNIPGIAIRSTVMVGFPGETDADFNRLLDFVKEAEFERLGAFTYSNEEGSRSYRYKDQVPEKVKRERLERVMKAQQEIARGHNSRFLGRTIEVLVDEKDGSRKDGFIARTEYDAPSVDGQVYLKGKKLRVGGFAMARITDTLEYDLVGETVYTPGV